MKCLFRSPFLVAALMVGIASQAAAQFTSGGGAARDLGNVTLPDARNSLGLGSYVDVTAAPYSAQCDGATDDSAAFASALTAGNSVIVPANKTCVAQVIVGSQQTLDLKGSMLKPPVGANYVVKLTGYAPRLLRALLRDDTNRTLRSSTLSGAAAVGDTALEFTSASGFTVGMPLVVTLNSGARWTTRINSIATNTVTVQNAIPASATAAVVSSGGAGCGVGNTLVVSGGTGVSTTLTVATVDGGGAVLTATVASPGFYTTAPANPVSTTAGWTSCATLPTFTLTTSGAASSSVVQAAGGLLLVDEAFGPIVEDLRTSMAPVGIQMASTGTGVGGSYFTQQPVMSNIYQDNIDLVGWFLDVGVSVGRFSGITSWGNGTSYGATGLYINGESFGASVTGGNTFVNANFLYYETGAYIRAAQLSSFLNLVSDSSRNYGIIIDAGTNLLFDGTTYSQYTGPNVLASLGSIGRGGIGVVVTNSLVWGTFAGLATNYNAADLSIDSGSVVMVADGAWGPARTFVGTGCYNCSTYAGQEASIGGSPGRESLRVAPVGPTGVNGVLITGGAVGYPGYVAARGADTDVGLFLHGKGNRGVNIGSTPPYQNTTLTVTSTGNYTGQLWGNGTAMYAGIYGNGGNDTGSFFLATGNTNHVFFMAGGASNFIDTGLSIGTSSAPPTNGALISGALNVGGAISASSTLNVVGAISDNGTAPTGTAGSGYVRAASPALSSPSLVSGTLTNVPSPSAASDAVPKSYADSIAAGVVTHAAAAAATTANLTATASGTGPGKTLTNSGAQAAFSTDGYAVLINERVLVKNQTLTQNNGIYTLTTVGTGATNWVLTRATDFDAASAAEVAPGASTIVTYGTAGAATNWVETGQGPFTLETTPIVFTQVIGASNSGTVNSGSANQLGYYAGAGTTISGLATANNGVLVTGVSGIPAISSTLPNAAQDLITRLGTIVVGVWNGTIIGVSKGGTGADLSATGGTSQVLKQASAGAVVTVGTVATSDLTATATNDNAAAGKPGEILPSTGTAVAVSSTIPANITSRALTPGDWDVSANITFNPAATTTSTVRAGGLSLTSATLPVTISVSESLARETGAITANQGGWAATLATVRVSTAGTPTVYCVGRFTFATSTATADCVIHARRVR